MQSRLHAALAAVALIAWLLFVLTCTGASWSPDGTKILFSYLDPGARQFGVAFYDLNTGTTTPLFLRAADKSEAIAFAQWQRDGSRALIFTHPTDSSAEVTVLAMPVGGGGTTRQFSLPGMERSGASLPFPEINGHLFVDGTYLARLNLETGQVKLAESKSKEMKFLFTDGVRLFFIRKREAGVYVVGEVDQETLKRSALFELTVAAVAKRGIEVRDIQPMPAMEPRSGLLALIAPAEGKDAILLCSLQGLERAFWPDLPLDKYMLSSLQWSQDGRTLYASALSTSGDKTILSLAEIPVDGSRGRVTEVARLARENYLDAWRGLLQLPLSPDGRTLALSAADLTQEELEAKDRALYLVKVGDGERRIIVVPAPHSEYPASALPEEPEEKPQPPPPPPGASQ